MVCSWFTTESSGFVETFFVPKPQKRWVVFRGHPGATKHLLLVLPSGNQWYIEQWIPMVCCDWTYPLAMDKFDPIGHWWMISSSYHPKTSSLAVSIYDSFPLVQGDVPSRRWQNSMAAALMAGLLLGVLAGPAPGPYMAHVKDVGAPKVLVEPGLGCLKIQFKIFQM